MGHGSEEELIHQTGGTKPFPIEGRFFSERERLAGGFTDADRAYRKQWLKDQELAPNEPRPVPELHREIMNPIRRAYRAPLDWVHHKFFKPNMSVMGADIARYYSGRLPLVFVILCAGWYLLKYNKHTWEDRSGWKVMRSGIAVYPGDPRFPMASDRKNGEDYAEYGFKDRKVFRDYAKP